MGGTVIIGLLLLGIAACSDSDSSSSEKPAATNAFVLTTDYSTGSYSTIDLDTLAASKDLPSTTGIAESDSSGVYFNNKVYIINRYGFDNVTVLDTSDLTTAVSQFSTGNGTNPQDMAFVSDTKAYVSLYAGTDVLIVDPTSTGTEIIDTIDLSDFLDPADADGGLEANPMVIVGDYLFVALQRLVNWSADLPSIIAVIDTTTDTLVDVDPATTGVQGITLTGRNPIYMEYDETLERIVVSEVGNYGLMDGGIETVDPDTFEAEGFMSTEAQLGGDIGDVVLVNGTKGYVVISDPSWVDPNTVAVFAVATGNKSGELAITSPFIPDLALDSQNRLFVPDRTPTAPGVRIFDTTTDDEVTAAPIDVGLPPNVIVLY
jgi:hypothetical protein